MARRDGAGRNGRGSAARTGTPPARCPPQRPRPGRRDTRPGAPGASARGTAPRGTRLIPLWRPVSRSAPAVRGPPWRADYTSVIGHEVHTRTRRRKVRDLFVSPRRIKGHETPIPTPRAPLDSVRPGGPRGRLSALDLRNDECRAGWVEPRVRLLERAAGAALGLRPADGSQAIRPPERHALRRRPGVRLSRPEASQDPFRALRHPYRPRPNAPNSSRFMERGRRLCGRPQDRALQVPEGRAGDHPDPGRPGAVELRSAPRHVRARVVLSERTATVPRPLAPERQLRPPAVRPRQRPAQPD